MASIANMAVQLSLDAAGFVRGLGGASTSFAGFGGAIGGQAGIVAGSIGSVADGLMKMAGAANPGLYAMLGDAWDDLQATIGQAFMPILRSLIPIVEDLGDIFAQLAPIIQYLLDNTLVPLFAAIHSAIGLLGIGGSAKGAAAKQAAFMSGSSYAEKAQLAAFSSTGSANPQEQISDNTKQILDLMLMMTPAGIAAALAEKMSLLWSK